jgi:lysine 2,3-aminomutase
MKPSVSPKTSGRPRAVLPVVEDTADWRLQMKNTYRRLEDLEEVLELDESEKNAIVQLRDMGGLPLGITPHYLNLIDATDPNDPLRRQVVPRLEENEEEPNLLDDPLGEEDLEVVPFLVHRYPDRVLLLATDRCASYCRFCTRKRMVGQGPTPDMSHLYRALDYIRSKSTIHEVIVSGGDTLLLSDERLDALLGLIREIPHIQRIRLATRMLTFAPTRITPDLVKRIAAHGPVFILSHFNHANELSTECQQSIARLVDHGIPILNQTVLLRGVNDSTETLSDLFRRLTNMRVHPYYLHQCDLVAGSSHFRVPLDKALELVDQLRGPLSGLCMPTFVVDIPGGNGKVPLVPNAIIERTETHVLLKGFTGEASWYPLDSRPTLPPPLAQKHTQSTGQ